MHINVGFLPTQYSTAVATGKYNREIGRNTCLDSINKNVKDLL